MRDSNTNSSWSKFRQVVQFALKFTISGFICMWLAFWYLGGSPTAAYRFFATYYVSSHFFMDPVAKESLFNGVLNGMVESLGDPHSQYLDQQSMDSLKEHTSGTYSGVGIVLGSGKTGLEVATAIEDQPAAKAGIRSGDMIVSIDGVDVSSITIEEASKRIRGEAGTQVVLSILRDNEVKDYTLTREQITLPTVKGKMLNDSIGYIRISQFAENSGADFAKIYEDLSKQGMKKLVLDLRDNPGGLVTTAEEIGSYLLPKGPIVTIQDRSGHVESYDSEGLGHDLPLVVLINKGSASASEIIAGAVQDENVGTIVGTNSYGKGTVQSVLNILNDEGIKITIAKYHTPNGRVIDGIGIKPDVEIDITDADIKAQNDVQLTKAIEILQSK
ncbi:S41 family peptidase [uncultured Veillonella sp.]|uniref:S41 family peptidase n=1 Tax=uncultured Veillonella sp. TaxID=159268 RepID=UPI0025EDE0A3|nr:S41 family peptidase [uncultured Veillonella sp.]MDY3973392.1 S41 family peptidase [Veillonella caviae]